MCGIAGAFGPLARQARMEAMLDTQRHRGPDGSGIYTSPSGAAVLGHNRLSIIDLSAAGRQPMAGRDGHLQIVFNGEIYNYRELRQQLHDYPYRSRTDTEVILAAYERWGASCVDRFIGMFALLLWDEQEQRLLAVRDRFGVKPLYYSRGEDGSLVCASEIKTLHAAGVPREPDLTAWADYLTRGTCDQSERTFWKDIVSLPPGGRLTWHQGRVRIGRWYDLAEQVGPDFDDRPVDVVAEEYVSLLTESIRLRFRADVPLGINVSGGLDSSTLLGGVRAAQGSDNDVQAFTYVTGDAAYDELPWVETMLAETRHPSVVVRIEAAEVPALAASLQEFEDEPFSGLPAILYARLFEQARRLGVIVLLDGQGMDEQWAGYDYYRVAAGGGSAALVQGTAHSPVRPECLVAEFRSLAVPTTFPAPFADPLRNVQYRDACFTKIPRALRFNDRASMRASTELREPFLDHRLFELALRQPADRKIRNGTHKWLLREMAQRWLPATVVEAPKRAVSTPQREWMRGPLRDWVESCLLDAVASPGGAWLDRVAMWRAWEAFRRGAIDNSFFVWQWISIALLLHRSTVARAASDTAPSSASTLTVAPEPIGARREPPLTSLTR
jgi:asparagine synthase (glutamine-hydrolysing)